MNHDQSHPRVSEEWAEDLEPRSLAGPTEIPAAERSRSTLVFGLLSYLFVWSVAAIAVAISFPDRVSGFTALAGVLATPVLPLLGMAVTYNFNGGRSVRQLGDRVANRRIRKQSSK